MVLLGYGINNLKYFQKPSKSWIFITALNIFMPQQTLNTPLLTIGAFFLCQLEEISLISEGILLRLLGYFFETAPEGRQVKFLEVIHQLGPDIGSGTHRAAS